MICSGCGNNFNDPDLQWCVACTAQQEEHDQAVEQAKLRVHRILRAMRDRPILLKAMHALMRPQTLEDAIDYLLCTMSEADLARVQAEQREELVMYHHGFGRHLRNTFRLHYETKLVRSCCEDRDEECADEASMAIIEALWERVVCDCENPPPKGGGDGVYHVSNACPVHG